MEEWEEEDRGQPERAIRHIGRMGPRWENPGGKANPSMASRMVVPEESIVGRLVAEASYQAWFQKSRHGLAVSSATVRCPWEGFWGR